MVRTRTEDALLGDKGFDAFLDAFVCSTAAEDGNKRHPRPQFRMCAQVGVSVTLGCAVGDHEEREEATCGAST